MKSRKSMTAVASAFVVACAMLFAQSATAGAPPVSLVQMPGGMCEGWTPADENRVRLQQSRAMNQSTQNMKLDCGLTKVSSLRGNPNNIIGVLAVDNHTHKDVCAQVVSYRNVLGLPLVLFKPNPVPTCSSGASSAAQLLVLGPQPNGILLLGSHTYISVPHVPGRQGNRLSGIHSYGSLQLLRRPR